MTIKLAHNRCWTCKTEWHDLPGCFAEAKECPTCGSLYWDWLNYETDFAKKEPTK